MRAITRRVLSVLALTAAGLLLLVSTPRTSAQPMRMWGEGMYEPSISTKDLERYGAFLELSGEQNVAAMSLLEGFQAEFERLSKTMREASDAARDEFRETRDVSVWEDLRPKFEEFGKNRAELEEAFMKDVKLLLSDEQSAKWPQLERMRRRDTTLSRGVLSGEGVDVIRLVEEKKLDAQQIEALNPVLDQYEREVDGALIERNKVYEEAMKQGMNAWRSGDMNAINELFAKGREAGAKVRDINRRFARQVESLLPEANRAAFAARFREASFPRVYRQTYAARAIELAKAFDDLTPEQTQQIETIRESYERESKPLNERWAAATEEMEMNATPMMFMGGGGGGSDAVREARKSRRDLDQRVLEKLTQTLTEEQAKRLPDRRNREEEEEEAGPGRGRQRRQGA